MGNCLALVDRQDHHLASPWWQAGMDAGARGEELGSTNSSTMSKKSEKRRRHLAGLAASRPVSSIRPSTYASWLGKKMNQIWSVKRQHSR